MEGPLHQRDIDEKMQEIFYIHALFALVNFVSWYFATPHLHNDFLHLATRANNVASLNVCLYQL